jgi:hypothetical protein
MEGELGAAGPMLMADLEDASLRAGIAPQNQ